ncbi:TMEM175 family protein [Sphingomonas sp.]|uniref:TMEM175 family protein n=1 Tax=Sphingomonas sp. TaxID=28214 RepID=UPI0025F921AC|nr:TMEM175 family protein [Sphingomonas sp.]
MKPERLAAFTDGVIAIIITIMVLELPTPHGTDLTALKPVLPLLGAYLLAFINVGIYWSNHHHMLQAAKKVDGRVLWANNAMLFVLSLVPFLIRWMGEEGIHPLPVALYGVVLVLAAIGYVLLERALIAVEGEGSKLKAAVGSRRKEWVSVSGYLLGAALAFISPWISVALYVAVTSLWFVPDSRIERQAKGRGEL